MGTASYTTRRSSIFGPCLARPARWPRRPQKDFATSGRPLPNLSLAVNYYFSHRYNPTGYHIFNAWVHIANAFLLWAIVRRTLRLDFFAGRFENVAEPLAIVVALLWAVHPLQIDAVQYITQRTELMMGFCYLLVLLASLHYWIAATRVRCRRMAHAGGADLRGWRGVQGGDGLGAGHDSALRTHVHRRIVPPVTPSELAALRRTNVGLGHDSVLECRRGAL